MTLEVWIALAVVALVIGLLVFTRYAAPAGALRRLSCRASGRLQLQKARLLPQLRRAAHGGRVHGCTR
jgi:hypothetical protein